MSDTQIIGYPPLIIVGQTVAVYLFWLLLLCKILRHHRSKMSFEVETAGNEPEQNDIERQESHEAREPRSISQASLSLSYSDERQSFNEKRDSTHATIESSGITIREEGNTRTTLCAKCWFIFDHLFEVQGEGGEYTFPFYSNSSFIKSNSTSGCCLCYQIHKKLEYLDIFEDCECGGVITLKNGPTIWFTMNADWYGNKIDIQSCFQVGENGKFIPCN